MLLTWVLSFVADSLSLRSQICLTITLVTECFRFTKTFYEDLFINVSILLCFPSRMFDHDVDIFFSHGL